MKRKIGILIFALAMILTLFPTHMNAKDKPSRILNVVYDDSGSTYQNEEGEWVDTWCQTKYAMEVFAGLLEEKDTLNIFPMSKNRSITRNPNIISVSGTDDVEKRVKRIHDMQTETAGSTPYNTVSNAYQHLLTTDADQKWLIVLTDGTFDDDGSKPSNFNRKFREYTKNDINVIFLTIGSNVETVNNDESHHVYAEKARNSSEVIEKITMISNQIFERNALSSVAVSGSTFSFDVPMKELIVFAQGNNIQINELKNEDERLEKVSEVNVAYSDLIAKNFVKHKNKIKTAKNLKGVIAVFRSKDDEIDAGTYTMDIEGAQQLDIYYKPNVDVGIRIFQEDQDVTDHEAIEADTYTIKTGFVDPKSNEFIESDLLGKIKTKTTIKNNGKTIKTDKDKFKVEIGDMEIDVHGTYLKYNETSISKKYKVLAKVIPLKLTLDKKDELPLKELEAEKMILNVTHEGKPLSKSKWEKMPFPTIYTNDHVKFKVTRGKEVSTFNIQPLYYDKDRTSTDTGDISLKIKAKADMLDYISNGELKTNIYIDDDRSLIDKIIDFIINYYPYLLALYLLICIIQKFRGPTGLFKHSLNPNATMTRYQGQILSTNNALRRPKYLEYHRHILSIIPITPITIRATIKIRHKNCTQGAPDLIVKSKGKNLVLLNGDKFNIQKYPNICEDLKVLEHAKVISLARSFNYSSVSTRSDTSGMTKTKSDFVFKFK